MLFTDTLAFDHPRKTSDGYMVVRARAARAGIYDYIGSEIDPEGKTFAADQVVRVYRSEAEVFAQDSVASFLMKPVTNNHPSQPVTAANWRDYAKGVVGKALRDGDFLAFDIVLMDKATIADVEGGKRELSNGYASIIDFTAGETEDGQHYDAQQKQIRGNHVAVVDKGRAGPLCRIGDAAACAVIPASELIEILTDGQTYSDDPNANTNDPARRETSNPGGGLRATQDGDRTVATKTILIDGYQFEADAALEVAVSKLQGQLKDEREGRTADKTAHDKALATKDAEIDDLKTKVVDQAKIDALADAKAAIVTDAKQIAGGKLGDTAGKSVAEVRRMACVAVLGDAALKDKSDEYVEARFDTLKDVKPATDPVRNALSGGAPVNVGDAKAEYEASQEKRKAALRDAYKTPANAA
jgi:hypothetical protein